MLFVIVAHNYLKHINDIRISNTGYLIIEIRLSQVIWIQFRILK